MPSLALYVLFVFFAPKTHSLTSRLPRHRVAQRRRPLCRATATRLPLFTDAHKPPAFRVGAEGVGQAMPDADSSGWVLGRASVEAALEELKAGRPILVTDDADRENEGDLIFAAESATAETLAFVVRHSSGVICVGMESERLEELRLVPMVARNEDPKGTAFTVSVDLRDGVTTGISAGDRAKTVRALADPECGPEAFCRPGHLFPLRARPGGVLERGGHTEASVDLARLAGLYPAGGLCEVVRDQDGEMSRWDDINLFAEEHGLVLTTIADLQQYRRDIGDGIPVHAPRTPYIDMGAPVRMPTSAGDFDARVCTARGSGLEHIAFLKNVGERAPPRRREKLNGHAEPPANGAAEPDKRQPPLVRIHSECATGDIFGSKRCDCGEQLEQSLAMIHGAEAGVLVYLRGHEGRGIGLKAKMETYAVQDTGRDTLEANVDLGHPIDARSYEDAAAILMNLGVREVRLMTNNPDKCNELARLGVTVVERVPLVTTPNEENIDYLLTKQRKMGHMLGLPESLG